MMGNLQSNSVSLRSPSASELAPPSGAGAITPHRQNRVDSIISQTSTGSAPPPSPFLPTVSENFGADDANATGGSGASSSFSYAFPTPGRNPQPMFSNSRRTSESSNSVDLTHSNVASFYSPASSDSPHQQITTRVDSFLNSTAGGTSSGSPASDSPTFRNKYNHSAKDPHHLAAPDGGHHRGSNGAGMDASLSASSSAQTASDADPNSLRRRKTGVNSSSMEKTFLIVSGGDGYCSWHIKDGADERAAGNQKRPGSASSSSGSSVNGSHQRLNLETNEASLMLWQMKL